MDKLAPGSIFAKDFRVQKPLREGGMGAVYVVEQISTGKQRALKILVPELVHLPEVRERFVREARAAANIESDHVVETVTAGVDEATGMPYLVMELLKGEELGDAAVRIGQLTVADVREVLEQIGHALEQAHAQGLVHRDLKPENIFLAASKRRDVPYTAKILDFGIAKLVADGMQKTGTQPLGSPLFMAPEQTDRKGRICPATDVWGLGLIAFYLLTGKSFWLAAIEDSLPALLREVCVDAIPPASERARELGVEEGVLPPGFDAWFAKCVDRSVDARFTEAGACVRAFSELAAGSSGDRKLALSSTAATAGPREIVDVSGPTAAIAESAPVTSAPRAAPATPLDSSFPAPSAPPAPKKSVAPAVGAVVALGLLGVGAFVFLRKDKASDASSTSAPSPSGAAREEAPSGRAAVASSAPAMTVVPADARCPAGMIHHPSGSTYMGSRSLPNVAGAAVDGRHVTLSSFCLDATEVTVRAYDECVGAGECEKAPSTVEFDTAPQNKAVFATMCNEGKADRLDHPINCVNFRMASTYCRFKKSRLPTEAEWEYAARGKGQRAFPWGDEPPDASRLNAAGAEFAAWASEHGLDSKHMHDQDDHWVGTAPVASFPAGKSSYGVFDLAGNDWEWTQDYYEALKPGELVDPKGPEKGTERVIRGGGFNGADPTWAHPAWRFHSPPEQYTHAIGFRCAADAIGEARLEKKP